MCVLEASFWGGVEADGTVRHRGVTWRRRGGSRHSHLLQGTLVCRRDGARERRTDTRGRAWIDR